MTEGSNSAAPHWALSVTRILCGSSRCLGLRGVSPQNEALKREVERLKLALKVERQNMFAINRPRQSGAVRQTDVAQVNRDRPKRPGLPRLARGLHN
jgi:hypothetical protein